MKGNPRHRIHVICFVAVLVLLTLQAASAVVLQYKGKAGDKFTDTSSLTGAKTMTNVSTGQTMRTRISGSRKTVTRVVSASHGVLELEITVLSGETTITTTPGRRQSRPAEKDKHWLRMTPQGKILERKPKKQDEEMDTAARVLQALAESADLPQGNINVGDVWRRSLTVREPGSRDPIPVTVESKLLGMAEFKGRSCAKIKTTFQAPVNSHYVATGSLPLPPGASADMSGKISGSTIAYFDPKLGQEVYSASRLKSSFETTIRSQGASQVIKSQASMNLKSSSLDAAH